MEQFTQQNIEISDFTDILDILVIFFNTDHGVRQ